MKEFRRMVRIGAIVLAFATLVPTFSQAQETITAHLYKSCISRAEKPNVRKEYLYVAWMPGVVHHCLASDHPPAHARKSVMDLCKKTASGVAPGPGQKIRNLSSKCIIAMDRGKIVSALYGREIKSARPINVSLKIFDQATGKLQTTRASFLSKVTSTRKLRATATKFTITANGVPLCDGTVKPSVSGDLRFTAKCFGETFRGKTKATKFVVPNGVYTAVPESVRIESKGSWIELRF